MDDGDMNKKLYPLQWLRSLPGAFQRSLLARWEYCKREYGLFREAPRAWLWRLLSSIWTLIKSALTVLTQWPVRALSGLWRWLSALTLVALLRFAWRAGLALIVFLAVGFFFALHLPHSQVPSVEPPNLIVYQDQGWGIGRAAPDRQAYYYTPQGAATMTRNLRYDWLVNLEVPWGGDRLADPGLMRAWGFQVDNEPTAANPDLLPVGFTKHFDPELQDYVLDLSCAACHTGALRVRQTDGSLVSLRIDGGQAMHAFTASSMPHFLPVLITSMMSTYLNPIKFDRFARKVLADHYHAAGKSALRKEFWTTLSGLLGLASNEILNGLAPVAEGFARTDALTRIANRVFGDHITSSNNYPGNAPVSYPPVWDIWKFDWVQYSGSVSQPMARNLGESLGVGAKFNFVDSYRRPLPKELHFDTSTRLEDLHNLETILRKLRPPVWQEAYLGEIDQARAVRGGIHFIRTCQGCHGPHPASDRQRAIEMPLKAEQDPHWTMKLLSVQEIGSDPNAAVNFVERRFDLSPIGLNIEEVREVVGNELSRRKQRELAYDFPGLHPVCNPVAGKLPECEAWSQQNQQLENEITQELDAINLNSTSNGQALNYIGLLMKQKAYADAGYTEAQIRELNGFDALDIPQVQLAYKARPLGGAWATAPYLHNGSVRNLYQLLSPQYERDSRFFIGRSEFDPAQVGLAKGNGSAGGMWFDTRSSGNANTGHEFRNGYTFWREGQPPQYGVIGPEYSDGERFEIIEYIKVHLDDPPHSVLFDQVFAGIVAAVFETLPPDGAAAQIAERWPDGQACNLQEFLGNHQGAPSVSPALRKQIETIQAELAAYFALPGSYECGGRTRYQRGGNQGV